MNPTSSPTLTNDSLPSLPIVDEATDDDNGNTSSNTLDPIHDTVHELNLDLTSLSSSNLSPTQIKESANAVISHLQKHGCISVELINFINGHPTSLSSGKMLNTAPLHCCFTIQQLSWYFGFHSLKN